MSPRRRLGVGLLAAATLAACAAPALSPRPAAGAAQLAAVPPAPAPTPTPAPSTPQTRPVDESRPVKVRSRSLRYDQQAQETVFYGGVTVTQDTTVLLAKELRSQNQGQSAHADGGVLVSDSVRRFKVKAGNAAYTDAMREARLDGGVHLVSVDPYGVPVSVTGQSFQYRDVSRTALVDGGVQVVRGGLTATAGSAELQDGGEHLVLRTKVRASMGVDRLQADKALFDQTDKDMELEGDVRARFIPRDIRQAAAAPWNKGASDQEAK